MNGSALTFALGALLAAATLPATGHWHEEGEAREREREVAEFRHRKKDGRTWL